MQISSPVTRSPNTSFIGDFDVHEIVERYQSIGINVRRFFGDNKNISLYQCNDSSYRFYHPFTIFGDAAFYEDLYTNIPDYYYPNRWEYGFATSNIAPGSRVLEIGCGAGLFPEKLLPKKCKVTGLEFNPKAIDTCRSKGLEVHGEFIEEFAKKNTGVFDVVCSFQVLEHVEDVKSFLDAALLALKPGGSLIISVPNSNPYFLKNDKYHTLNMPPHHSGLWNKKSLTNLVNFFPMELQKVKIEPLKEFKEWYKVQRQHYKETKPWLGKLMGAVPRPIYKSVLRGFASSIEGAYITAVYLKK